MRYSEGVKRYYEDTKKRIFDEVIAAAEAEKTAEISQADDIAVIIDEKKEGITMKNTNTLNTNTEARIRSNRGGIVAAACALLAVGVGAFAVNHMSVRPNVDPGAKGTAVTTDAEDTANNETDENKEQGQSTDIDTLGGVWWEGVDPAFAELIDTADLVCEVQIVGYQEETVDGVDYIEYFCSLTREENGSHGTVFKYTGEDELPDSFSLMQRLDGSGQLFGELDCPLVIAKNGAQDQSGDLSFELSSTEGAFHFEGGLARYVTFGDDDRYVDGDYTFNSYECEIDSYYKTLLHNCGDIDVITNWCDFHFIDWEIRETPCEYEGDFRKGDLMSIEWFNDGVTVVIDVCSGEAVNADAGETDISLPLPDGLLGSYLVEEIYNEDVLYAAYFDGREMTELDLPMLRVGDDPLTVQITSEVTGKSVTYATLVVEYEKGTFEIIGDLNMEGLLEITPVEDTSIGVETSDKGGLIEGFEGYAIETSEVDYSSVTGISVVFSVSKADGTPFPEDYLDNNSLELIYGDLIPFMSAVQADELNVGQCRLGEDGMCVEVAMSTAHAVDPSEIDMDNEITIRVNSIVENGEVVAEGLFETTFSFVNNEIEE